MVLVVVDAVWYSISGVIREDNRWSSLVISVVIYSSIVASNFLFLNAMRQRSSLHVKAFIAGNGALALTLTLLLVVSGVRIITGRAPPSIQREISGHGLLYLLYSWTLRVGFVFFMILMAATYFRLWFTYDADGLRLSQVLVRPLPSGAAGEADEPGEGGEAGEAGEAGEIGGAGEQEAGEPRARTLSVTSKRRAVKFHITSLVFAFSSSVFVGGLLLAAAWLNTEALWEALA